MSLETLRSLAASGEVSSDDLVWNQSMKDWMPAHAVAGVIPTAPAALDPANPYAVSESAIAPHISEPWAQQPPMPEIEPGSEPLGVMACVSRGFTLTARHFGTLILALLIFIGISWAVGIPLGIVEGVASAQMPSPTVDSSRPIGEQMGKLFTNSALGAISPISILNQIISTLTSLFLTAGVYRVCLNIVSGRLAEVRQMFTVLPQFLRIFGGYLLMMVISLFALLPAAIPLIVMALRYFGPLIEQGTWNEAMLQNLNGVEISLWLGAFLVLLIPAAYVWVRLGFYMVAIVDRDLGAMESLRYSWRITRSNGWRMMGLIIMSGLLMMVGFFALCVGMFFTVPLVWVIMIVAYRWLQYGHRAVQDVPGSKQPVLGQTP